jgi:hypothetical protein
VQYFRTYSNWSLNSRQRSEKVSAITGEVDRNIQEVDSHSLFSSFTDAFKNALPYVLLTTLAWKDDLVGGWLCSIKK